MGSKAENLHFLSEKLTRGKVEPLVYFSVKDWCDSQSHLLSNIVSKFSGETVVVRSSTQKEDGKESSYAGCFESILGVEVREDGEDVKNAVEKVIDSFKRFDSSDFINDSILVQSQTMEVKYSGVLFTRTMGEGRPYFFINYDDKGDTTAVTSGKSSSSFYVLRDRIDSIKDKSWKKLIECVLEIETYFPDGALDIEFAIRNNGEVVIFQVRPLVAAGNTDTNPLKIVSPLVDGLKQKFSRCQRKIPHIAGKRTIFSDMADWNPAEIIGDRPNSLDYSLYRFLITDNEWHRGRTSLGYYDVYPSELMTSFGKKPYIDTRLSFNSMTPAELSVELREKLVDYYLDRLAENPELHDKVEFKILYTCYYPGCGEDMDSDLGKAGFIKEELTELKNSLEKLTFDVIRNFDDILATDHAKINDLEKRRRDVLSGLGEDAEVWELNSAIHYIFQSCRELGTTPFSQMARIAFIGKSQLVGMLNHNIISQDFYDCFFKSVKTVNKDLLEDISKCKEGSLSFDLFFKKYGHLRAGTYDITSPRYDKKRTLIDFGSSLEMDSVDFEGSKMSMDGFEEEKKKIGAYLKKSGGEISVDMYLDFIAKSLEARELFKFEFSKCLSDGLELIAEVVKKCGIPLNDASHTVITDYFSMRNPEISNVENLKTKLSSSINVRSENKDLYSGLVLPQILTEESDFEIIPILNSKPNFVTKLKVESEAVEVSGQSEGARIAGKIVLIENADPGFDWVFTHKPRGLITKFGGMASHMAIRCAELGLPAAIGCGSSYDDYLRLPRIVLDCSNQKIYGYENGQSRDPWKMDKK